MPSTDAATCSARGRPSQTASIVEPEPSCGLIAGAKAYEAQGAAKVVEDQIFAQANEYKAKMMGSRRFAWCYLEDASCKYNEEKAHFTINFTLQKGSYATVVLEEILHKNIFE